MASLTLKNLSDDFLKALRDAADHDRRSLTQEIIHLLDTALRARPEGSKVEAQVAQWRKLAGKWKSDVDASAESRRILKRRTPGRKVDL